MFSWDHLCAYRQRKESQTPICQQSCVTKYTEALREATGAIEGWGGGEVTSALKNCLWVKKRERGREIMQISTPFPPTPSPCLSVTHSSPVTHLELSLVEFTRGVG